MYGKSTFHESYSHRILFPTIPVVRLSMCIGGQSAINCLVICVCDVKTSKLPLIGVDIIFISAHDMVDLIGSSLDVLHVPQGSDIPNCYITNTRSQLHLLQVSGYVGTSNIYPLSTIYSIVFHTWGKHPINLIRQSERIIHYDCVPSVRCSRSTSGPKHINYRGTIPLTLS